MTSSADSLLVRINSRPHHSQAPTQNFHAQQIYDDPSVQQMMRAEGCMPSIDMHAIAAEVASISPTRHRRLQQQASVCW
jgi:hypothetical protein